MVKAMTIDWRAVWWTTIFVTIPALIIDRGFARLEKSINEGAYQTMRGYFSLSQPDSFYLLYLLLMFIAVFAVVLVYTLLLPQLPSNWIVRGMLVGGFIFVISDLPYAVHMGYTTMMPGVVAKGTALAGLASDLVNGCILANVHMRVTRAGKKK